MIYQSIKNGREMSKNEYTESSWLCQISQMSQLRESSQFNSFNNRIRLVGSSQLGWAKNDSGLERTSTMGKPNQNPIESNTESV